MKIPRLASVLLLTSSSRSSSLVLPSTSSDATWFGQQRQQHNTVKVISEIAAPDKIGDDARDLFLGDIFRFDRSVFQDNDDEKDLHRDLQGDNSPGMRRCERSREIIEWRIFAEGGKCTCIDEGDTVVLSCATPDCQRCNAEATVCYTASSTRTYDASSADSLLITQTAEYSQGRNESLVLINNLDGSCNVTIDGEVCSSCQFGSCEGGGSSLSFDCSNIATVSDTDGTPAPPVNLCDRPVNREGVLEYINEEFSMGCESNPPIVNTCQRYDDTELDDSAFHCRCAPFYGIEGGFIADCRTLSSSDIICTDDGSVCGIVSLLVLFDPVYSLTERVGIGFGYNITNGFNESYVSIIERVDSRGQCFAAADQARCDSCQTIICDNRPGIAVECGNIFTETMIQGPAMCAGGLNNGTAFAFLDEIFARTREPGDPPMDEPIMAPFTPPMTQPMMSPPVMEPVAVPVSQPVLNVAAPIIETTNPPVMDSVASPVAPSAAAPAESGSALWHVQLPIVFAAAFVMDLFVY